MNPYEEYPAFVASLAKPFPKRVQRINHALLGIIGELGELTDAHKKHAIYEKPLDRGNVIEELGDIRFYLQMLENEGFIPLHRQWHADFEPLIFSATIELGKLTECLKRMEIGLEPDGVEILLGNMLAIWAELCELTEIAPESVVFENIRKLSVRYPDKAFSTYHASARLDKAE